MSFLKSKVTRTLLVLVMLASTADIQAAKKTYRATGALGNRGNLRTSTASQAANTALAGRRAHGRMGNVPASKKPVARPIIAEEQNSSGDDDGFTYGEIPTVNQVPPGQADMQTLQMLMEEGLLLDGSTKDAQINENDNDESGMQREIPQAPPMNNSNTAVETNNHFINGGHGPVIRPAFLAEIEARGNKVDGNSAEIPQALPMNNNNAAVIPQAPPMNATSMNNNNNNATVIPNAPPILGIGPAIPQAPAMGGHSHVVKPGNNRNDLFEAIKKKPALKPVNATQSFLQGKLGKLNEQVSSEEDSDDENWDTD